MAHLESLVILDVAGKSGAALGFGFERSGLRAYATREPDDAFAMARTRVPHLVIVTVDGGVDDHGHNHDELALIGRLREEPETRELPIVAVGEHGKRDQALRAGADEYVTRPAFIRDVLTLAKLAVAVRQDGDEAGVVGMLEDYGLYFLVRALAVAGRSCVLELERGHRQGEVHFAKGAVVAARAGRMIGIAALQHLLLWGEAAMSLRFESPAGERKISAHVDELLETGAGFAREFEKLAGRVGGAQAVYAQEPMRTAATREQIPVEVMALVKQYDGLKPLIDIVEDSPFKPFDTIKITYRLAELGAIVRRPAPHEVTPLSAQLAVREWLLGAEMAREESAPRGEARGVTEAGRRAAEAYAQHEAELAREAHDPSPGDELLNDTVRVPTFEPELLRGSELHAPESQRPIVTPEPSAPREEIHDEQPTVPRESKRAASGRNKRRKSGRPTVPAVPSAQARSEQPRARSEDDFGGVGDDDESAPAPSTNAPTASASNASASSTNDRASSTARANALGASVQSALTASTSANSSGANARSTNAPTANPPSANPANANSSGANARSTNAPTANPPTTSVPAANAPKANASSANAQSASGHAASAQKNGSGAHANDANANANANKASASGKSAPADEPKHAKDAPASDTSTNETRANAKSAPAKNDHSRGKDAHAPVKGVILPEPPNPRLSTAASAGAPSKNVQAPARPASTAPTGPVSGKLSPQAISRAHTKEPIFNDMEEEFFAREEELARPTKVENFDDLEHPRKKGAPKRPWFPFGKK